MKSVQKRKQRLALYSAPLHKLQKLVSVHLSKELRQKHKHRRIGVRKGDKVKVLRGDHKGTIGKVEEVDLKNRQVFVEGLSRSRVDGTKVRVPIVPSNLVVLDLNMDDDRRRKVMERR